MSTLGLFITGLILLAIGLGLLVNTKRGGIWNLLGAIATLGGGWMWVGLLPNGGSVGIIKNILFVVVFLAVGVLLVRSGGGTLAIILGIAITIAGVVLLFNRLPESAQSTTGDGFTAFVDSLREGFSQLG